MKKGFLLIMTLLLSACSVIYEHDSRSPRQEWQDSQLTMHIASMVNKNPYRGEVRINATSYEGQVLLIGQARTQRIKDQLIHQVKKIRGVQHIFDQIRIRPPLSFNEVSTDTWITTKVKSALIASKKLRNVNIEVMTENKEVFLLGYVTKAQGDEATHIVRNLSDVKQVIQGFRFVK